MVTVAAAQRPQECLKIQNKIKVSTFDVLTCLAPDAAIDLPISELAEESAIKLSDNCVKRNLSVHALASGADARSAAAPNVNALMTIVPKTASTKMPPDPCSAPGVEVDSFVWNHRIACYDTNTFVHEASSNRIVNQNHDLCKDCPIDHFSEGRHAFDEQMSQLFAYLDTRIAGNTASPLGFFEAAQEQ